MDKVSSIALRINDSKNMLSVFTFLILLPTLIFAEDCREIFSDRSLRQDILSSAIKLIPLQQHHNDELMRIFSTNDVTRFFLGIHREPLPDEVYNAVSAHLKRAQNVWS